MKQYTKLVNDIFDTRTPFDLIIAKRYPRAHFAVFDINSFIADIYHNPQTYLPAPANVTGVFRTCPTSGTPCVDSALSIDHFLWFDELHPSTKTDEIIAKEFITLVKGKSKFAKYW